GVSDEEALGMGLAKRIVEPGTALASAVELGKQQADFPQRCVRSDRLSAYEQWSMPLPSALELEVQRGMEVIRSGETREGATRFAEGTGRHGSSPSEPKRSGGETRGSFDA